MSSSDGRAARPEPKRVNKVLRPDIQVTKFLGPNIGLSPASTYNRAAWICFRAAVSGQFLRCRLAAHARGETAPHSFAIKKAAPGAAFSSIQHQRFRAVLLVRVLSRIPIRKTVSVDLAANFSRRVRQGVHVDITIAGLQRGNDVLQGLPAAGITRVRSGDPGFGQQAV